MATAQARAGDAKAGQALANYASDLLSAADAQVTTRAELVKLRASVAASLEESTTILGKQAPVQGSLQPIEELVQANSDLNRTVAELKVELVIMRQQLAAIQTNTRRAADGVNGQGEGPIPVVIET